jgi:hypothetical protein
MARFVAPPTGWVTLGGICGLRRVSRLEAEASREMQHRVAQLAPSERRSASLQRAPVVARDAVAPLAVGVAPRHVAAAVASGALPEPVRGAWGSAWPVEAVKHWAATRG